MLNHQQLEQLLNAFPRFQQDADLLAHLKTNSQLITVPKENTLCHDGQLSSALPLVISGTVRVYKIAASGREITLYHIIDGESCILTAASILGSKAFPAIATTEQETQVVLIPAKTVQDWLLKSQEWQQFIFELIALRMTEMITVVEEVAFQRMDRRIAKYLLAKLAAGEKNIHVTHQVIAAEIGTAREVVTRILRELDRKKVLELTRGNIRVISRTALKQLLDTHD
ncbi:MAG TPA: Crp/Fnr family transcriptional regulator [Gammaproteobacteria bacterium]|nr:Crp/Fnr family transcriptional regulator [Gammaproteobacteria bacterium]